jgi:RNA polymerase sigma-70 factor, ECF subfamily
VETSEAGAYATKDDGDRLAVARVLAGDTETFADIMRRHNQRLFRLARSIVKNDAEAEDVVQESYVRAFAALSTFEGRATLGTWLARITVNEALGRLRWHEARKLYVDELSEGEAMSPPSSSPEQQVSDEELRPFLESAIDALPPPFRTVFVLRAVEQLSTQQTAETLGIAPETVKTRLFRARALLRDNLVARIDTQLPSVFPFLGSRCDSIVGAVMARIDSENSRA